MKGLLLKDFYTLGKSLRMVLLLIVVFAFMPGYNMALFGVVYASLLPVTAISYDERCKWDSLAAMLPYSPSELVAGKYILGYLAVAGACLIALAAQAVYRAFGAPAGGEYLSYILGGAMSGLLIMALTLPAIYKFGAEKGRIVFFVILAMIIGGGAAVMALAERGTLTVTLPRIGAAAGLLTLLAVVLINLASIALSIRFYSKKEF